MRAAGLQRAAQRRAGADQVGLPDVLVERARAQPVRERPVRTVAGGAHGDGRPITSTPGGGVKTNKSGASLTLRFASEKLKRVT